MPGPRDARSFPPLDTVDAYPAFDQNASARWTSPLSRTRLTRASPGTPAWWTGPSDTDAPDRLRKAYITLRPAQLGVCQRHTRWRAGPARPDRLWHPCCPAALHTLIP